MPANVMVGYDGSPAASAAINAGAALFPNAHAWVAHIWQPPFAGKRLRRRLRAAAHSADELAELIEREGAREADTIVGTGVALAKSMEWDAEPLVKRTYGSDGLRLAQLAERLHSDVLVIGDRGLDASDAVIGSVCDMVVHYATVPVLVVPNPLLAEEFAALAHGPVVVGYDGSPGSEVAARTASGLFEGRKVILAAVRDPARCDRDDDATAGGQDGVEILSPTEPNWFGRPRDRAVADTLIEFADRTDAAVLVVGSRGRSAVREVLLGSVAVAAVNRSHRPVLVVHS